jgi:hypothetical protein
MDPTEIELTNFYKSWLSKNKQTSSNLIRDSEAYGGALNQKQPDTINNQPNQHQPDIIDNQPNQQGPIL